MTGSRDIRSCLTATSERRRKNYEAIIIMYITKVIKHTALCFTIPFIFTERAKKFSRFISVVQEQKA